MIVVVLPRFSSSKVDSRSSSAGLTGPERMIWSPATSMCMAAACVVATAANTATARAMRWCEPN
jgi:hypothetical protein